MKTRLFVLALVIGLSVSLLVPASGLAQVSGLKNQTFSDVSLQHKNFDSIYYLYNTGIVEGYDVGGVSEYRPDNAINRAEFLTLLMEGTGKADYKVRENCFSDVGGKEWYATFVCQAKEEGWVAGYSDGNFRPDSTINDVEAIKIIGEVSGWTLENRSGGEWYEPYWDYAHEHDIVVSDDVGSLMDRGDIAEVIFRDKEVNDLGLVKFDDDKKDDFFAVSDIPYNDPVAPGGIFGYGGAFAEDSGFELLDDSFFDTNYCYFSDSGDYVTEVRGALEAYSQQELDSSFFEGVDVDGFGKMFCYDGHAATDLVYFDDYLRDQYTVYCWKDRGREIVEGDEILCYVEEDAHPELSYGEEEVLGLKVNVYPYGGVELAEFDAKGFPVVDVDFRNDSSVAVNLDAVNLHSVGAGVPYGVERIYVEENGSGDRIFSSGRLNLLDWRGGAFPVEFDIPLRLEPGVVKRLTFYADLDWEYYAGNMQFGFVSKDDFAVNNVDLYPDFEFGPEIARAGEIEGEDGAGNDEMCLLLDEESNQGHLSNQAVVGGYIDAGDSVTPGGEHVVKPIDQGDEPICMAASVYSSLRFFEEKFGPELIEDGRAGLDELINALYGPDSGENAREQLEKFTEYVNGKYPGCLDAAFDTRADGYPECETMRVLNVLDCDTPITFVCHRVNEAGDRLEGDAGKDFVHAVDLVNVDTDAANEHKCNIQFANSWKPKGAAGVNMDGLGAGRYEDADYNDETGEFTLNTTWGQNMKCELYSALYMCFNEGSCGE